MALTSADIRIEAETVMSREWRDDGHRIGPGLSGSDLRGNL